MSIIFILRFINCRMEEEQYYMGRGFGPGGRPFGPGPMGGVSSKHLHREHLNSLTYSME